jgi:sodium transport system ATP-binding protein
MIAVRHLHKQFGKHAAVRDLSFDAPDGCITGLLGANGAGKSTTLRIICGALAADEGDVHVDEGRTAGSPANGAGEPYRPGGTLMDRQRSVGALLDHTGLYARLTARENLTYFGRLRGLPPARLAARVEEIVSLLGLDPIADRHTAGFSQGERMKTALGRALLHAPRHLVLDEPTNGLDIPTIRALRALLQRLRLEGVCIIFSSHVLEDVRLLCDTIVIVANGRAVAQGTPDEVCRLASTRSLEDAFVHLTGFATLGARA